MSQYKDKIERAQTLQKRRFFLAFSAVLVTIVLLGILFVSSRATRIEILPIEAGQSGTISMIDGVGLCLGTTLYSLTSAAEIAIDSPGFAPSTLRVIQSQFGKVLTVTLKPLPGRLQVKLLADSQKIEQTKWKIDDRFIERSAEMDIKLEAGNYTVTIDNPYYQQSKLSVQVNRGAKSYYQQRLIPVEGTMHISSQPTGATVFVDGIKVGQTPLVLERPAGVYQALISYQHYLEIDDQLTITRSQPELNRNYRMRPQKVAIDLELSPPGGTLLVDGIKAEIPLSLEAAKKRHLSYSKEGYFGKELTILPLPGQANRVQITLQQEKGEVEITTIPSAFVWVDSVEYGITPLTLELPAITQTITIKKPGFRSVSEVIKPRGDRVQKITVQLIPENQARLAEAPRELTNSVGMTLRLFQPNTTFTMGAPRSEPGQRANEFLRRVTLDRPFYAGVFEVSNGQYAKFDQQKKGPDSNLPVTMISWQRAAAFCNWLSIKEKLQPFYIIEGGRVKGFRASADGYRMLSEAEWEWLARKAGKSSQTIFSWGNDTVIPTNTANVADESAIGQLASYVPGYNDGYPSIAPVGKMNREPSTLFDMAGNVSEWVHDVYSIIPPAGNTENNPLGEQQGTSHVVKGASFRSSSITTLRPAFRQGYSGERADLGFRVGRYLFGGDYE